MRGPRTVQHQESLEPVTAARERTATLPKRRLSQRKRHTPQTTGDLQRSAGDSTTAEKARRTWNFCRPAHPEQCFALREALFRLLYASVSVSKAWFMAKRLQRSCSILVMLLVGACGPDDSNGPADGSSLTDDAGDVRADVDRDAGGEPDGLVDTDTTTEQDVQGDAPDLDADTVSDSVESDADASDPDIGDTQAGDVAADALHDSAGNDVDDVSEDATDVLVDASNDIATDVRPDVADVTTDVVSDVESPPTLLGSLTTETSSLTGILAPRSGGIVLVDGSAGDRIRLRVVNIGTTTWDPAIRLYEPGGVDIALFVDPPGTGEPLLPPSGSLELTIAGTWEAEVRNYGSAEGALRFEVECVAGPCNDEDPVVTPGDRDGDGTPDASDNCPLDVNFSQADDDGDGYGNACDGVDPWAGLSNDDLEAALRAVHTTTHRAMGYRPAREVMFSSIDNVDGQVECVYTGLLVTTMVIPPGTVMNTEHTWPQSRGAAIDPMESDIHHLFPTESVSNSTRNNFYFCDVTGGVTWSVGGSVKGTDADGRTCFEPRESHRGNVARALFYFAVMYADFVFNTTSGATVGDVEIWEEPILRVWHVQDPPDAVERRRNAAIEAAQGSRNPFIDYPHLVDRISNF